MLNAPKRGRPAYEPRIAALEARVKALEDAKPTIELVERAGERRGPNGYVPAFDKWPSKSPA